MQKKIKFVHLIIIAAFTAYVLYAFKYWIFSAGIVTHGDWGYYFHQTMVSLREPYFTLWLSDTEFGRVLIDVGQAPTYSAYGWLASLFNIDYSLSERLIHLWPTLFVAPIASYLLLNELLQDRRAAFVGASIFAFNNYFLELDTGHLTLATAFAVSPLAILFYFKAIKRPSVTSIILSALFLSICSAYEPRSAYIVVFVMIGYASFLFATEVFKHLGISFKKIYQGMNWRSIFPIIPIMVIFAMLNFFWIFGLSFTGSLVNNEITSRGLFGNSFFSLIHALALFDPFWTGRAPSPFIVNPIPLIYWIVPVCAFVGLYMRRSDKRVIFFGIIGLIGILLSKQVDAPIQGLYPWLYAHVPGFNAFREASKFYYLIALSYSILVAAFCVALLNTEIKKRSLSWIKALAVLPLLVPILNLAPLENGSIGTLFKNRNVPPPYIVLAKILGQESSFSRTLWLPVTTRWSYSDKNHPSIHDASLVQDAWKRFTAQASSTIKREQNLAVFHTPFIQELLISGGVKYIFVPPRQNNDDEDLYASHGYDRDAYVSFLQSVPFLSYAKFSTSDMTAFVNNQSDDHVSLHDMVYKIGMNTQVSDGYSFLKYVTGGARIPFFSSGKSQDFSSSTVASLFGGSTIPNISGGTLKPVASEVSTTEQQLYKNIAFRDLSLAVSNGSISVVQKSNGSLLYNNSLVDAASPEHLLSTSPITGSNGYFSIGNQLYPVDTQTNSVRNIGVINDNLGIFEDSGSNLLVNSGFETGTWQSTVEDCNNYDKAAPMIAMSLSSTEAKLGKYSLELSSHRHTACTSTEVNNLSSGIYKIQFNYKLFGGRELGYKITYDDPAKTVIKRNIEVNSRDWNTLSNVENAPAGTHSARITLLVPPDDRNQNTASGYFDSVEFNALSQLSLITQHTPSYEEVKVSKTRGNNFAIQNQTLDSNNLILNPSFENGSWQKIVGDCNAYDTNPDLSMQMVSDHTDGEKAIELSAGHHTACIGQHVIVTEGEHYILQFDYRSLNAQQVGYSINFNDPGHGNVSQDIPVTSSAWGHYSKEIIVPFSATNLSLSIYGYSGQIDGTKASTEYDNFKLVKKPAYDNLYFLANVLPSIITPPRVQFKNSSFTKYEVEISSIRKNTYLSLSEAYNPSWRVAFNNAKVNGPLNSWAPSASPDLIASSDHFMFDDYLNGWYLNVDELCRQKKLCSLNADGSYDIKLVIEYAPERWFNIGLIISGITLLGCVGYLGYAWRRRRR
jgi:hypothetical protein